MSLNGKKFIATTEDGKKKVLEFDTGNPELKFRNFGFIQLILSIFLLIFSTYILLLDNPRFVLPLPFGVKTLSYLLTFTIVIFSVLSVMLSMTLILGILRGIKWNKYLAYLWFIFVPIGSIYSILILNYYKIYEI